METRVKDVVSSLELGTDEVRIIRIKGMGGAGKTTTARAVFDNLSNDFEAKSFVENVREVSNGDGLKKLQEQVLLKVLNEHVTVDSVNDGKNMMKERMRGIKVLLVLDDVNHIDQLEALAGGPSWFKPGSRIIVTTRDEQVLVAHRVNLIRDIDLLSKQEAIYLFNRYAFGTENPVKGYEELSGKVVRYAAGLPLTIKVLGSFLCGKDMDEWEDAIERLKDIPLKETLEKLELSYISLEDDYKEMFLDIACILKGQYKKDAIRILECCGFHARNGLKVLEQRSLITIKYGDEDEGYLGMHDHIEEMGKNIVRRSHPEEPNQHSRLWIDEEIEDILANDMGSEATRCLKLKESRGNSRVLMKGLGKMKNLRYLEVELNILFFNFKSDAECLNDTSEYFPNSLKYLRFRHYPFYLPKTFQVKNLVELDMHNSKMVQLWDEGDKKVLKKLKFLSLSMSKLTTFDFRITPNLETLSLEPSIDLAQLFMPASCQMLKYVHISFSKLRTFDLGLTPNLETLSLECCDNFEDLQVSVACPNLKILNLYKSRLRSLDLELFPNLEILDLNRCFDFVELQVSAPCPNLKSLNLYGSRLRSLDLKLIPNLERLDLNRCDDFVELQVSAPNLERLDLENCRKLVEINAPVGCLKRVGHLNLTGCLRFRNFHFRSRSEQKDNCSSATLDLFGESLDSCPLHPNSNLPKLRFDVSYKEYLSSSVGNIERLISFGLCACTDFKKFADIICSLQCLKKLTLNFWNIPEFPKDLGKLECLEELTLFSKKIKHLPDIICLLKRLISLISSSDLLEKLPEDLGRLECLEELDVRSKKIEYLPDSICMLKRLTSLKVDPCHLREKLPEDLGRLECLEELEVRSKKIEYLPDSICMLKHLKSLAVNSGDRLEKLPEDLGRLECLEELCVSSKKIEYLPDSICMLKCLKVLVVIDCCCLVKLPEDIGQLECLEKLYLLATMIKHLPDSVCMLKHLNDLSLSRCGLLEKLPEDLGRLGCLKYLEITGISHLPQSIFGLKGLWISASEEVLDLYYFPSEIKTTTEGRNWWVSSSDDESTDSD